MQPALFHVELEGRTLGPYDRRTIVGMRVRKALPADAVLIDSRGTRLTVRQLIERRNSLRGRHPQRDGQSTMLSSVIACYTAKLLPVPARERPGVPAFRGTLELRIQGEVLRIAGRWRQGWGQREGRIKLPLRELVHARVRGGVAEVWMAQAHDPSRLRRLAFEFEDDDAAGEFADCLPHATPWPGGSEVPAAGWVWRCRGALQRLLAWLVARLVVRLVVRRERR